MNNNIKELLEKYRLELYKIGINSKKCEDYCGQIGCRGLEDEKTQLEHAAWMIQEMLDAWDGKSERKTNRWLGFIQGILWSTKMRGILELKDESRHLYE